MRIAAVRVAEGNPAAAVEALDGIANDSKTPQPLRDMAAIRAAYILVDTGSADDVRARVQRLTGDDNALRFAARETLGLSTWKTGDLDGAKTFFQEIRDDGGAPSGIALRAGLMLEMIAAGSLPPAAADPAVETAPAPASVTPEPAAPAAAPETPAATSAPAADAAPAENPAAAPVTQAPAETSPAPAPTAAPADAPPATDAVPPAATQAPAPVPAASVDAPVSPAPAPATPAVPPS
jgi:hypothetical protein